MCSQRKARLDDSQTAAMIKFAAQRPGDKVKMLRQHAQKVGKDAAPELSRFGLKLGGDLAQVQGRVLPNPVLAYGGGQSSFNPRVRFCSFSFSCLGF